jgi:hypothetical protein
LEKEVNFIDENKMSNERELFETADGSAKEDVWNVCDSDDLRVELGGMLRGWRRIRLKRWEWSRMSQGLQKLMKSAAEAAVLRRMMKMMMRLLRKVRVICSIMTMSRWRPTVELFLNVNVHCAAWLSRKVTS